MSVQYYDSQIAQNQNQIAVLQKEIADLENKISELKTLKSKLGSLTGNFCDAADQAYRKASALSHCQGLVTAFIKSTFFGGLLDAIKGSDYSRTKSGLEDAQTITQNKINELQREIEQKQGEIRYCQSRISTLKNEKAAFQAAEARKAEEAKKAAEAAKKAEKANKK